jgi:hypothetical protein
MASEVPVNLTLRPERIISPSSRRIEARNNLNQCAFAGAVGPEQGVNLAGTDVEIHRIQRYYARKGLPESANRKHRARIISNKVWRHGCPLNEKKFFPACVRRTVERYRQTSSFQGVKTLGADAVEFEDRWIACRVGTDRDRLFPDARSLIIFTLRKPGRIGGRVSVAETEYSS